MKRARLVRPAERVAGGAHIKPSTLDAVMVPIQPSAQAVLCAARARIYERLDRAVTYPVLVMHAPPGYGKSTVLREFLTLRGRQFRRICILPGQADLLGCMRAFATGAGDLAPGLPASFAGMYDRMQRVEETPKQIAAWAAGHLKDVECTLVLDGIENASDERFFDLLSELAEITAASNVHWIFVAETVERLPIARWLVDDRMDLPLDDIDLALTYDDLRGAVERTGIAVPPAALLQLCVTAKNWPATIALALNDLLTLSSAAAEALQGSSYTDFAQRAFAARLEREQRFLIETCLFKQFDLRLLALAGWPNAAPLLDRLQAAGAILFSDSAGTYRYHERFRAFLEERLSAGGVEIYDRLRSSTAAVCVRAGRWSDALELYTALQAANPLAQLLTEHGFELVDRGDALLVAAALSALGDAELTAFPVALALKASLESLYGSQDIAEAWFRLAIENAGVTEQRAQIVFRFATDLVRQDRPDAIAILEPIVAQGGHAVALSVSLAGLLATAYATNRQNDRAAFTISDALRQLPGVDDRTVRAKLYFQAGYVAFFAHDPAVAKKYAQQAVDTASAAHLYDIAARALSILYNVAMDYDDDVRAGRHYLEALAACSLKAGSRLLQIYAALGQFELAVLRGDLIQAAQLDAQLGVLEVDYSVFASETLLPAQALRASWSGDFQRAYRLVAPTAKKQITAPRQALRHAEIGLYAAAAGLRSEAFAALGEALDGTAQSDAADRSVVLTKAYVALAATLLGSHQRAADLLAELSAAGVGTPRTRQLVQAICSLNVRWALGRYSTNLQATLERLDACDFGGIGRLIEALPLPETFREPFTVLSELERELLVRLSAGLDAAEISVLSGQSAAAIEGLSMLLCRKLGCNNARDAIALAQSAVKVRGTVSRAG